MSRSSQRRFLNRPSLLIGMVVVAGAVSAGWLIRSKPKPSEVAANSPREAAVAEATETNVVHFPRDSWPAASLEVCSVCSAKLAQAVELTGKITLNEDKVAHVFPLVEGRVNEVKVQFGDKVRKGAPLVIVQSKEVGQAMLQLFQDRLQHDFARHKDQWVQAVTANVQAMIKLMDDEATIEAIEKQLTNRPLGEYRDRLMSAYIGRYKSRRQLDRLTPLSEAGAVTGKQILDAETELSAARATMQSLIEQIQHEAEHDSIISTHSVRELETRVAVDETNLKILGFDDAQLKNLDPARQGEAISHYPVYAPFDGTIISKDVVLLERVGPERQILSIADLSTVWVTADIYEEHLPLLKQLERQVLHLRSKAWPGKTFEARIFYTGDVVDEATRTISLRAVADNRDGLLKPGMFVNIEFPDSTVSEVLQVPVAAIQEHEGKSFVFVHAHDDAFERRDVSLGRRNADVVEIRSGVRLNEEVVTGGGFVLKSKLLASLLEE